ncbi:hypothetical protein H5410_051140 [Solanum commersonii]|uniref:Uncharacterized protein n=1 Tax=Solanum commersonii TaxID=4109 RepID=A0A9J5WXD5_SOLCO|nr:hypothetical protein H5410_051140 [Solanum commersonii]
MWPSYTIREHRQSSLHKHYQGVPQMRRIKVTAPADGYHLFVASPEFSNRFREAVLCRPMIQDAKMLKVRAESDEVEQRVDRRVYQRS